MTYVVAEPCVKCKYTDCVDVCPVDCSYEGENFLVISPEECIDCGACLPECPIDAIVETEEQSPDWAEINKELAPEWKGNTPVDPRPANDPPNKPENAR